jgi:hypothetical protein
MQIITHLLNYNISVIFFPLNVGVKQGENLSPSLFKIFVNDLPSYLPNTSDPVNVNGEDVHFLMYADDIIYIIHFEHRSRNQIN